MKNRRFFFLYQNTVELNLIKFIINLFPPNVYDFYIFCVKTSRLNLKSISGLPIKTIMIDEVIYSKFLPEQLKKAKSLRTKLSSLNITESDTFVTQPLYSLNNFILYSFFKKRKAKIISYSLNSINIKKNKFIKLSFFKSFKHSIYTLLYSRKLIFFYNVKNTIHNFVFTRTVSNIHLDFGPSFKNEMINSIQDLKFENVSLNLKIKQNSNDILLLIKSHKSDKIFGFPEQIYLNKIREISKHLKSMSFSVFVKNHPSSSISDENLAQKVGISRDNIISKKIDFEHYLKTKSNNYRYILSEDSSTALTLHFHNINYYTINELLLKGNSVLSKIFGLNILYDLNDLNKMKLRKFNNPKNYSLNKLLFKDFIENV